MVRIRVGVVGGVGPISIGIETNERTNERTETDKQTDRQIDR